jgi:antitoxin component of RelBE/YafQ-DinJ toxin-antitoxin module
MYGRMKCTEGAARKVRASSKAWSGRVPEALEDRKLLSSGMASTGLGRFGGGFGPAAEMGTFAGGRQSGFFGGGSLGLRGGMNNPSLLFTAPMLEGGSGQTTPPSPAVFSDSSVQTALQTLQTDLKTDVPSGAKPTHASVGALQDDLTAIRKGTLSGSAATAKIQADQAAILASMGLTQAQVTQIQSDQQALQTAISTASASTSSTTSTSGSATTSSTVAPPSSAVQTAFQTLQTALSSDNTSNASPSHESIGQVQDDLDAIRNGTLSGTAAVTKVQTDAAAVLTSMGLTSAQVSQIQADQGAVASAMASDPNRPTTTSSSSATMTTLQSVSEYLVGLPGVGMDGFGGRGMRSGGGFGPGGGGGFGSGGGQRGGFMGWH